MVQIIFLILKNILLLKLYSFKSKIAINWYGGCGTFGRVVALIPQDPGSNPGV